MAAKGVPAGRAAAQPLRAAVSVLAVLVLVSGGGTRTAPSAAVGSREGRTLSREGPLNGVFVASEASGAVLVLDPNTLRANAVLPLGGSTPGVPMPHQMVMTPDRKLLLVTEFGMGTLAFFDLTTRQVVGEVPVGGGPHGVALSPDGRLAYVAASQSKVLSVVDVARRRLVAQIPTHLLPWQVVVSPDGSVAWITSQGTKTLAEVDLRARKPRVLIDLGEPYVVAAALLPDGRLAAGGHSSNRLFVISRAARRVVARPVVGGRVRELPEGRGGIGVGFVCAFTPSGVGMPVAIAYRSNPPSLVVVTHGTNELVVLGLSDLRVLKRFAVGDDPQDVAVSQDGRFAYVSAGSLGELWKVGLNDGAVAARTRVGPRPIGVLVAPARDGSLAR